MEKRVVAHREGLASPPINDDEQKPKKSWRLVVQSLIYTGIIVVLAYAVLASNLLRINNIEVEGNQTLDSATIESQTKSIITSSSLAQNILFVSSDTIKKQLKENNFQISDVKVERVPLTTLKLTITEQKPSILWQSGNEQAILAQSGYAYTGEPSEELKKSLPTVLDSSNLPIKTGEKVVTEEFIQFVTETNKLLPENGVEIETITVADSTSEILVKTKSGYIVRLDTTRPLVEQTTDLKAVLDSLKKQGKKITEYIDLRINARTFYK